MLGNAPMTPMRAMHSVDVDYLNKIRQELDQIELSDDLLIKLKKQRKAQLAMTRTLAETLSAQRKAAAERRCISQSHA